MNEKLIRWEEGCPYTEFITKCEKENFKYIIKCKSDNESAGPATACNTLTTMFRILLEYKYRGFSYTVTFVDESKASKYLN